MTRATVWTMLLAVWLAVVSCSDSRFEIELNLMNYSGNIRAFYVDDDNAVATPVGKVNDNGNWTLSGNSSEPTLVSIISSENQLLCQVVACNGDHIVIDGDAMHPYRHRISGNSDLSREWADWRRAHAELFLADESEKINDSIADYINNNPANPLSTVLLVAEYRRLNDNDAARRLLATIKPEARLPRLLATVDMLSMPSKELPRTVRAMQMMEHGGEFVNFVPQQHNRHWLLIFWDKDVRDRHNFMARARRFVDSHAARVSAADIFASPDTITWSNIIRNDSARWQHFWAPAGTVDQAVNYLRFTRLPAFVATDSLGNILYQGYQLQPALNALEKKLRGE